MSADLTVGVAEWLAANALGTWKPTGAYGPGDGWPIFFGHRPATPDMILSLTPYPVDDDPSLSDSTVGMQVWIRADSGPANALRKADDIFQDLHGLTNEVLGGVHVVQALRMSGASQGRDSSGRWEYADNYYFTIHQPSKHRE